MLRLTSTRLTAASRVAFPRIRGNAFSTPWQSQVLHGRSWPVVEFKRILCALDLSELSVRTLAYAGAIARWYDAHLTALHVVPSFTPMDVRTGLEPVSLVYPLSRDEVLEQLRKTVAAAGLGEGTVALTVEAGEAAATVVNQALVMHVDLLVLGTHGRSGFDRFFLGSVAEKVLRKAPCPVLTIPPHAPAMRPSEVALRTILCPIDFSSAALEAFGFALDLARRSDASVVLVHALEFLAEEEPRAFEHFNVPEFRSYLLKDARQRLDSLVSGEPKLDRGVRTVVVVGRAHHGILNIATDEGADLIVMGAQGRGGAALALFGPTTQQVVRGATCPVLTVR
jgi:nucleotide-binding universal stress UspA family protein